MGDLANLDEGAEDVRLYASVVCPTSMKIRQTCCSSVESDSCMVYEACDRPAELFAYLKCLPNCCEMTLCTARKV